MSEQVRIRMKKLHPDTCLERMKGDGTESGGTMDEKGHMVKEPREVGLSAGGCRACVW